MTVYLKILLANFCLKNSLENDVLQKNRTLYSVGRYSKAREPLIGGEASTRLVVHSLAPQTRKLQPIDKLFLAKNRGFKRLYEGGFKRCQMKR